MFNNPENVMVFNETQITSPQNGNKPTWGLCHTLSATDRPPTVIIRGGYYIDTTHADDVVRIDETVAPLQARDYKGGKLVLQAIPCALRNRGFGKEMEIRMDDDKSNALTSVQTDSLVLILNDQGGGGDER